MSFSQKVKEEITSSNNKDELLVELTTLLILNAKIFGLISDEKSNIFISTDNKLLINKLNKLIYKIFGISADMSCSKKNKILTYQLFISPSNSSLKIIKGMKYSVDTISKDFLKNNERHKAFIKNCFLSNGYINDPNKSYHIELLMPNDIIADQLMESLNIFNINTSKVVVKNSIKLYLKDAESISTFLSLIGANASLFEYENIRVIKDVRNNINRKVNFETANIGRIVSASKSQLEDIEYIKNTVGLDRLDKQLREISYLRLQHENASLQELASYCSEKISKSGINHRLKKINEIATELRNRRTYVK